MERGGMGSGERAIERLVVGKRRGDGASWGQLCGWGEGEGVVRGREPSFHPDILGTWTECLRWN